MTPETQHPRSGNTPNWTLIITVIATIATIVGTYYGRKQYQYAVEHPTSAPSPQLSHSGNERAGPPAPPASSTEAARQRLKDQGIEYSEERFYSALQEKDAETIGQFVNAGKTLGADLVPFVDSLFDEAVAHQLLRVDESAGCPARPEFYIDLTPDKRAFVRAACGKASVVTQLRNQSAQPAGEPAAPGFNLTTPAGVAACKQDIISHHDAASTVLAAGSSPATPQGNTFPWPPNYYVQFYLWSKRMDGRNWKGAEDEFRDAVAYACSDHPPVLYESEARKAAQQGSENHAATIEKAIQVLTGRD